MLLACIIAVLSVLLGALLGFWRRTTPEHLGPIKTFAFAAAVTVVLTSFLPEAMGSLGAGALIPLAVGFFAPHALEAVFTRLGKRDRGTAVGLEVGYVGLAIHQLADGIGMGSLVGPEHEGHHHLDVFLAVGGHTVPLAAVVVLAFVRAKGRRVAARRAAGLACLVVCGVIVSRYAGVSVTSTWGGVTSAVVGGLLLHIAAHDLTGALPKTSMARAIDLVAAITGVLIVTAGDGEPGESGVDLVAVGRACRGFAVASAPGLVVGFVLVLALTLFRRRERGRARSSLSLAEVDAGLVAGALGLILLDLRLAVPYFAVWLSMAWAASRPDHATESTAAPEQDELLEGAGAALVRAMRGVSLAAWPWWALGVGVAAFVMVGVHATPGIVLDVVAALALALVATFGPPLAVLLTAALTIIGVSEHAELVGLMAGLAAWRVRTHRGPQRIGGAVVLPLLVGGGAFVWFAVADGARIELRGTLGLVALVLALAVGVWLVFREGARGAARVVLTPGTVATCEHGHAHDDQHAHVTCIEPHAEPHLAPESS